MLTVSNLKVEYKTNPIGMDELSPRFSYKISGTSKRQSACKIIVKDPDGHIVWDSGFIATSHCCQIIYRGEPLKEFTRYTWSVQVKDENGKKSEISKEDAYFETGFLLTEWKGQWIAARGGDGFLLPPQRLIRRFTVSKKLKSARLYTAALGLYEAYINGKNVTEDVFTPGWTDYRKRVQYQAYDVTDLIQQGNNMLADLLGDGWFCGRIARNWNGGSSTYGRHAVICQELHITYEDGTIEKIVTDDQYRSYIAQPSIRMSDIYMGETYDATEDDIIWKTPQKPSNDETAPNIITPEAQKYFLGEGRSMPTIEWQAGAPIRRIFSVKPVSITKREAANTYLVDLGQNITGRERIKLKKTVQGTAILIRHGEMLNKDGSLYTANLRSAAATTLYLAGNATNVVYEPVFTFYGFRYMEISGWPGKLDESMIEVQVIHSSLDATGKFECSNPLINKLFSNIVWGQRGNFLDVPTDCPQRDERLGWTGDTQVFTNIATYNMDCAEFYTKWIRDLNSDRSKAGGYKGFVPDPYGGESGFFGGFATGWSDAAFICPNALLKKYGDLRVVIKYFDNMKQYLYLQIRAANNSYIVNNACYGDWLNLNDDTDRSLLSTSYLAGMARLLAHQAELIGRLDDARELYALYEAVKKAYQKKFFKNNKLQATSQTAMLLTLHFDLAPANAEKNVIKELIKSIKITHDTHLSTGFLGTPLLLNVLTKIGEIDLAYDLLQQTTYPGWLYPVTQGATTMWERWNSWNEKTGFGDVHMNSFNHYAYGAVGEWFYENICGIQPMDETPEQIGFNHFKLAPKFGKSLDYASAYYNSQYGEITSAWTRTSKKIRWIFTVPCGTTAEIELPNAEKALKNAGITFCKDCGKYIAFPGEYEVNL